MGVASDAVRLVGKTVMPAFHRPALLLLLALFGIAAAVAGAAMLARGMPTLGLAFQSEPGGRIVVTRDEQVRARIEVPSTLIGVAEAAGPVALDGNADAPRRSERGLTRETIASQDRTLAAVAGGYATLVVEDRSRGIVTVRREVRPRRLGPPFWLAALPGMLGAAVGAWVLAVRPRAAPARALAVAGSGLLLAALPLAVLGNAELIVGGTAWHALVVANWTAAQVYGAGLIACFLTFPTPLGTPALRRAAYGLLAATVPLVAVPTTLLIANLGYVTGCVCVDFLLIAAAVAAQWRAARRDPAARAALRLMGGVTVATLAIFLLLYIPGAAGSGPVLTDAAGFAAALPPFLPVAVATLRGNFLGLGRWTGRLFAVSAVLLVLVATDAALVLGTGLTAGSAASAALLVGGAAWIVARQALLDRALGGARRREETLYGAAGSVALAATPAEQFERWSAALRSCFSPLEMVPATTGAAGATVEEGGLALLVPAPGFGSALRLRAARGGTTLFRARDAAAVDTFTRLCARAREDRAAYDRGTREERRRIARDLHDDVSGRLLTSLHRRDEDEVRADVRAALRELRTLVSDLQHGERTVEEVVAAVRAEASERLVGAGVALTVAEHAVDARPLDANVGRAAESAVREAVTNVLRHANASRVDLSLSVADGWLVIELTDDGRGLDDAASGGGNGLRNMAERLAAVGGDATVTAGDAGGGMHARFRLPLARRGDGG